MSKVKKVIFETHDGSAMLDTDKVAITLNFPMWFGDKNIQEINDKNITVVVYLDKNGNRHLHLENAPEDLIVRVARHLDAFRDVGGLY